MKSYGIIFHCEHAGLDSSLVFRSLSPPRERQGTHGGRTQQTPWTWPTDAFLSVHLLVNDGLLKAKLLNCAG